jgi:hypothetical protein
MAKRKRSYSGTAATHRQRAGGDIGAARYYAQKVRKTLAAGNCTAALRELGSFNRMIGGASAHLRFARGTGFKTARGGGSIARTAKSLEARFNAKCLR